MQARMSEKKGVAGHRAAREGPHLGGTRTHEGSAEERRGRRYLRDFVEEAPEATRIRDWESGTS